jgi:hypothetical protein
VSDWQAHKATCNAIAVDVARADSHIVHKREFDRIRARYGLDSPENAESIVEMLSNAPADGGVVVSAPEFANMFGMTARALEQ